MTYIIEYIFVKKFCNDKLELTQSCFFPLSSVKIFMNLLNLKEFIPTKLSTPLISNIVVKKEQLFTGRIFVSNQSPLCLPGLEPRWRSRCRTRWITCCRGAATTSRSGRTTSATGRRPRWSSTSPYRTSGPSTSSRRFSVLIVTSDRLGMTTDFSSIPGKFDTQ